jgi:wyosine [tRNA(Phe)-imidazoG37] synthetase (radical SAM superfamily)
MPSRSAATAAPTLYPALAKVIVKLKKLRDRYQPDARIAILSNSSTAGDPAIRAALELLDLKIMKFDADSEEMFGQLNHPAAPVYMDKIVVGLKELKNTLLQSCFVQGSPTPILIRLRCGSRNSGKFIRWESKSIHWIVSRLIKNSEKSV